MAPQPVSPVLVDISCREEPALSAIQPASPALEMQTLALPVPLGRHSLLEFALAHQLLALPAQPFRPIAPLALTPFMVISANAVPACQITT